MEAIEDGSVEIALVTDEQGVMVGTLSDGDVRRALLEGASMDARAEEFANPDFTFVAPEVGRAEVLDLMQARAFEQIPILDKSKKLVGLHLLREVLGAAPRENWAVIMAGGRGKRLQPITDSVPKPMIRVAGRPILERIVLHLVGHGIRTIHIAVNWLGEVIEEHFGDGKSFGCEIRYLREEKPMGTGGGLSLLSEVPDHPLLVLNGDLVTQADVGRMVETHCDSGAVLTVGAKEYFHTVPFGVLECEGEQVNAIREKPTESWLANGGIYVLDPSLPGRVPGDGIYNLPDLVTDCIGRGEKVGVFRIRDDWTDVGRHGDLKNACGEEAES
jgi:dTDP-glucose pyrophosphorylase